MGRRYHLIFENVSVSAVQDLVQINGATGKTVLVRRVWLNSVNATPTAQQLRLRGRYVPATVTNGSGGSTPTPRPLDPGDAAATFTARANSTTQATSSGTIIDLWATGCHVQGGVDTMFPTPFVVPAGAAFVFDLAAAPTGTLNLSGGVEVEEIG